MFEEVSDEVKLDMIKSDLDKLMYNTKMLTVIQSTMETYRLAQEDDAPDDIKDYVKSREFTLSFDAAIKANGETINNILVAVDSIASLYDIEFRTTMPKTAQEFQEMVQDLSKESLRLAMQEHKNNLEEEEV